MMAQYLLQSVNPAGVNTHQSIKALLGACSLTSTVGVVWSRIAQRGYLRTLPANIFPTALNVTLNKRTPVKTTPSLVKSKGGYVKSVQTILGTSASVQKKGYTTNSVNPPITERLLGTLILKILPAATPANVPLLGGV